MGCFLISLSLSFYFVSNTNYLVRYFLKTLVYLSQQPEILTCRVNGIFSFFNITVKEVTKMPNPVGGPVNVAGVNAPAQNDNVFKAFGRFVKESIAKPVAKFFTETMPDFFKSIFSRKVELNPQVQSLILDRNEASKELTAAQKQQVKEGVALNKVANEVLDLQAKLEAAQARQAVVVADFEQAVGYKSAKVNDAVESTENL